MKWRVALLVLLAGCSVRKLTIDTSAELMRDGSRAMESEPDVGIARAAIPGQLKSLEGLLVSAPRHRALLEMAARGYLEYAFGFLEDDLEGLPDGREQKIAMARATLMYDRSFFYALRLLETFDPNLGAAVALGETSVRAAVDRLPAASVAGLTFAGMALASAANMNQGDPARLADLPLARTLLRRAHALDPRFYHGAPAMVLGIISAKLGDKDAAREYFREAIAAAGDGFLMPRVIRARILLDREDACAELAAVLATPRDVLPAARLANELARRRAARYLDPPSGPTFNRYGCTNSHRRASAAPKLR